jgi:hypothetical protein
MPQGQHHHDHGGGTATAAPEPMTTKPVAHGCTAPPLETSTCCDLICFERPRYFCGHLLTDTDLSTAQQYVIEKHKLYHRSLHGYGIVCGLRLTCDSTCCGYIRIDEGYAIDDCGNDIVVCERARFDVLARLKERKLLIPTVPRDPCAPPSEATPCPVRQCFYVVVCYQEVENDFTTPLSPACGPSPSDCEATRVREAYAFDVVDVLPAAIDPIEALKERIDHCFALFSTDAFGVALAGIRDLLCRRDPAQTDGQGTGETASAAERDAANYDTLFAKFCELRGLLLLYLKKHPDQYNCRMEADALAVTYPTVVQIREGTSAETPFFRLIELAYNHALSCALGELAFGCPEPSKAACVVLGTVEVEDGCVVRVCNCPRKYVWSFASFFQVLAGTLLGDIACETVDAPEHRRARASECGCEKTDPTQTCCVTFPIDDHCEFLDTIIAAEKNTGDIATAVLDTVAELREALRRSFSPANWRKVPAGAFVGRTLKEIREDAYLKNLDYDVVRRPLAPQEDPLQAIFGGFVGTKTDRFELEVDKKGRVVDARREAPLSSRLARVEEQLATLMSRIPPQPGGTETGGGSTPASKGRGKG